MKCVLIVRGGFQYFNHPRWEARGDGGCYITRSPLLLFCCSLCFFEIPLLKYIFKSSFTVKRFVGTGLRHDYMLFPKKVQKKKRKKKKVATLADHVLSALWTIMLLLILSSVFVEAVAYLMIALAYCKWIPVRKGRIAPEPAKALCFHSTVARALWGQFMASGYDLSYDRSELRKRVIPSLRTGLHIKYLRRKHKLKALQSNKRSSWRRENCRYS